MIIVSPLKIAILTELNCASHQRPLIAHRSLCNAVHWLATPQPTYSEIDDAIADLDRDGLIICISSDLQGDRWGITDAGSVALWEALAARRHRS